MESWSYVSQGKGFVSDDSISAPDVFGRGKNGLMGWELKTPCNYDSNLVENQGFVELGFPEMPRKSWPENNLNERICTPITSMTNAFSGEDESSSKFSSSVVESNSRDSSFIDLKLGRIADDFRSSQTAPVLSSSESLLPTKRVRAGLSSQTPFCQVYGCKKDLSSSKDYHKRHKVCEVHAKTAKVIVNGNEQRFCQQCSRFHSLAEFDDGKRSCRKRLAGHNERRRKPHVGTHSGRSGRFFQSYNGSMITPSSFICQDILPSNILHPQKYDTNDWNGRIKLENGANYSPPSAIPITNGHLHPKSLFPHGFEKHCPFLANGVNSATGRDFNENSNRYTHYLGSSNSVSGSLIHNTSIGSEDFALFNSGSTVQGIGMSDCGRALSLLSSQSALSLLSSQSQNSSSHSSGIPMAQIVSGSHANYNVGQISGKILGVSSQASINGVTANKFNSVEENHFNPILISDDGDAVNFTDGMFQGSQYLNDKDRLSCEDGSTIDLLKLSSQLQRVEHQRQFMHVKRENDAF